MAAWLEHKVEMFGLRAEKTLRDSSKRLQLTTGCAQRCVQFLFSSSLFLSYLTYLSFQFRAYTIQIPLPNVPTFVVALVASYNEESADDILAQHDTFLDLCDQAEIKVLSIGSDGAASELSAQEKLNKMGKRFLTYSKPELDVHVTVPLFGNPPRPVVTVQDPKHARKTSANQLLSGARLLSMGFYHISIQNLALILESGTSPLVHKDVFDSDKQDDGRAYRITSYQTLEALLATEGCIGLSIYLFVVGEMTDAWLNQHISHSERLRMAFTAMFFLRQWEKYLGNREKETKRLMNLNTNFISHQSAKIFGTLANSLLALIIAHREYYPNFPLMPWKHGTEPCEHIFGWIRVISPTFTVLDAGQIMPKIYAVVKSVMSGRVDLKPSEHMHAGYQFAFATEAKNIPINHLACFSTDQEIGWDLTVANQRAKSLAEFTGMGYSNESLGDVLNCLEHSLDDVLGDLSLLQNSLTAASVTDVFFIDISTSLSKEYVVRYDPELNGVNEDAAIENAAVLTGQQHGMDRWLEAVPDEMETELMQNSAMSISCLLNAQGK